MLRLTASAIGACILFSASGASSTDSSAGDVAALDRVALIGASVTDGFLIPNEVYAMVTMADTFEGVCAREIETPLRRSSAMMFLDPERWALSFVEDVEAQDPTLVIAVDFLFWFGFGYAYQGEESRLARLEEGLALLERFDCPVLIGDFPDVSDAAVHGVGIHGAPMISPAQVPKPQTLKKLNERVHEWASQHDNAHVVPMGKFLARIAAGEAIDLRDNHWPAGSFERLMDKDRLHPNFTGLAALTVLIADTLVRAGVAPADAFEWDVETVKAKVLDAREPERAIRMRRVKG